MDSFMNMITEIRIPYTQWRY